MRTNHLHLQMYFRREEVQYVKLLFSSSQPAKFLHISFHFYFFFLNVNSLAPHGRHGGGRYKWGLKPEEFRCFVG